jgi:hypothetical protein
VQLTQSGWLFDAKLSQKFGQQERKLNDEPKSKAL